MATSLVYFFKLNQLVKIKDLLPKFTQPIGVKVHFGEQGNVTFIPADLIRFIVMLLNQPTLIECSVLYKSPRSTASGHKQVAIEHGFSFTPIDFLDGEAGDDSVEIKSSGRHFTSCFFGKRLIKYNSLLVISHFKGHLTAGFGGAIKNLGMGLASRRGKLAQHASIKHQVDQKKCTGCGYCITDCPTEAIKFNQVQLAEINQAICISCSKCISICPVEAINIPWESTTSKDFQEKIAEYAKTAIENKQCYFINFLINITELCDCNGSALPILTPDIGVLASADPVAIDQASYDLVLAQYAEFNKFNGDDQLNYGEKIGLGSRKYELIKL